MSRWQLPHTMVICKIQTPGESSHSLPLFIPVHYWEIGIILLQQGGRKVIQMAWGVYKKINIWGKAGQSQSSDPANQIRGNMFWRKLAVCFKQEQLSRSSQEGKNRVEKIGSVSSLQHSGCTIWCTCIYNNPLSSQITEYQNNLCWNGH